MAYIVNKIAIIARIGNVLSSLLPAIHSLTGCDITSKVGTKKAALKADPELHLVNFGRSSFLSPSDIRKVELY